MKFLGNIVHAADVERIAAQQTPCSEDPAFKEAEPLNSSQRIGRAGRIEPASCGKKWRNKPFIKLYGQYKQIFHHDLFFGARGFKASGSFIFGMSLLRINAVIW